MHRTTSFGTILSLAAYLLIGGWGCGSSNSLTGANREWSKPIGYEQVETSHVDPDQGSVLVGEGKNFMLMHGDNGNYLRVEPQDQGFGGMLKSMVEEGISVNVNGVDVFTTADRYSYAFVDFANTVMVLDYTTATDRVRMLDMSTGKILWESKEYEWSLAKYKDLAGAAAKSVLKNIGMGAGAAAGVSGAEVTRERYAQHLVAAVPEKNAILFRTTDGLLMMDVRSGDQLWKMENYGATGIEEVRYLPEEDELLMITQVSRLFDKLQTNRKVMRVDAGDGTVKWATKYEHSGGYFEEIERAGNRLVLKYAGGQAEIFDFATGKSLFKTHEGGAVSGAQRWLQANMADSAYKTPPALIHNGSIFTIHTVNIKAAGTPDKQVVRHTLDDGTKTWTSPVLNKVINISGLYIHGEVLIANLTNTDSSLVALNLSDGTIKWTINDMGKTLQIHLEDNRLYASNGNVIRSIDPQTGKTLEEIDISESGLDGVQHIGVWRGNLYVVGVKGISVHNAKTLTTLNKWLPKGRIESHQVFGNRLYMNTSPLLGSKTMLRVVDLDNGRPITSFEANPGLYAWFGNLRNGVFITGNGNNVYVLDTDKLLTKYRINRKAPPKTTKH